MTAARVAATLALAITVPASAWAMDARVQVSFEVRPNISVRLSDEDLTIRSNTPWVLSTTSAEHDGTTTTRVVESTAITTEGLTIPVVRLISYSLVADL